MRCWIWGAGGTRNQCDRRLGTTSPVAASGQSVSIGGNDKVQDDEITIEVLEDSQARQLVAEMMILAGEVAGRYGQAHNIALPFRGQPQPELPSEEELLKLPAGSVRACAMRRCMPRVR